MTNWELFAAGLQVALLLILKLMVRKTHLCTHETQGYAAATLSEADSANKTIQGLNQRLLDLENEIKLHGFDSARLIEWLDKRDRELHEIRTQFSVHLNLEEREELLKERSAKIVELGEQLRLIRR